MSVKLTDTQLRELTKLYHIHRDTVGTFDWPKGRSIRLKTGKSLEKMGLAYHANKYSANRYKRWGITEEGIRIVSELEKSEVQKVR